AAELLARLPESRLTLRMIDRAKAMLTFQPKSKSAKRDRIDVALPAECDKAMTRDGIEAKPPPGTGVGEKAWWLTQIVGAVPPPHWIAAWSASAEQIVAAVDKSEWAVPMVAGWSSAAVRHHDRAWAEAMLGRWREGGGEFEKIVWQPDLPASLVAILPAEDAETFIAGMLDVKRGKRSTEVLRQMLGAMDQAWSLAFARVVLRFVKSLAAAEGYAGEAWPLREALKEMALRMPPALAAVAGEGWLRDHARWNLWAGAVDDFVATLQFRHDMLKELQKEIAR